MSSDSEHVQSMDSDSEEESIRTEMEEENGIKEEESGQEEEESGQEEEESEQEAEESEQEAEESEQEETNESDDEVHGNEAESTEEDEEEAGKPVNKISFNDSKNTLKRNSYEKYERMNGISLPIHFRQKLPMDMKRLERNLKERCGQIIRVRRPPRESIQRFLVDFSTREDCAKAMEELQSVEYNGKKLYVGMPETDKDEFIGRRDQKPGYAIRNTPTEYTSTLIVMNIPAESTISDIINLFPHATNVRHKPAGGGFRTAMAIVRFPSNTAAKYARCKQYKLGENHLHVVFAKNDYYKKYANKNVRPKFGVKAESEEQNSGSSSTKHEKNKKDEQSASNSEDTQKGKRKYEDNNGGSPGPKKMKKTANSSEVHVKSFEENSEKEKVRKQKQLGKKDINQKEVKDQKEGLKAIKKVKSSQFEKPGGEINTLKAKKLKGDETKKIKNK